MSDQSFCLENYASEFQIPFRNQQNNLLNHANYVKQFVFNVLDFTSQYGSDSSISYTAYNLTGKPSNYPNYGDFPQAFTMKTYGTWWKEVPSYKTDFMPQNHPSVTSDDYVDVEFYKSVYAYHMMIYQTYNPGAVVRIWARHEEKQKWVNLWEGPPQKCELQAKIFAPTIRPTSFKARIFRIEFNHSLLEYFTGIDAILLLGTELEPSKFYDIVNNDKFGLVLGKITQKVIELNLHSIPIKPTDLHSALREFDKEVAITENEINGNADGYFRLLPDETILKIFGYLDLRTLGRCLQLNKHLKELASDSFLYSRLSLKPYWSTLNDEALLNLGLRAKHLQKLDFSWCGNYGLISQQTFVKFIKDNGRMITHIRLNSCKFVSNSVLKAVSETCTQLQEVSLRNCGNITGVGFLHLTTLSLLESLDLYRTQIDDTSLVPILQNSPNLKHLNIGSCKISNMEEVARTIGTNNHNLISLDLWKTKMSPECIQHISHCSHLQELDIGWCIGLDATTGDVLGSLAKGCPRLKKLFLSALRGIGDKDIELFIPSCPDLEQIDLLGAHGVTPDGCFKLLCQLQNLRYLDLGFCRQITDTTISNWRQIFPNVAIKYQMG